MVQSQFWIPQDALGEFISKMITGSSNVVQPQFAVNSSLSQRCRQKLNSVVQRVEENKPPSSVAETRLHTRHATLFILCELENQRKTFANMLFFTVVKAHMAGLFSLRIKVKTFRRDLSRLTKRTSRIYHRKDKQKTKRFFFFFFAAFCSITGNFQAQREFRSDKWCVSPSIV